MMMGATLFGLAVLGGYLLPNKASVSSTGSSFSDKKIVERETHTVAFPRTHQAAPQSRAVAPSKGVASALAGSRQAAKRLMSVAVDSSFDFDEQALREKVTETIELDGIADVPHQYDFWQNLSRENFLKWDKIMSDLPENKAWFAERVRLMYEYSQAKDSTQKRQVIEGLKKNQLERIRITELVISMAKAENPSINIPLNERTAPFPLKQSSVQPPSAAKPPEPPKVFQ